MKIVGTFLVTLQIQSMLTEISRRQIERNIAVILYKASQLKLILDNADIFALRMTFLVA